MKTLKLFKKIYKKNKNKFKKTKFNQKTGEKVSIFDSKVIWKWKCAYLFNYFLRFFILQKKRWSQKTNLKLSEIKVLKDFFVKKFKLFLEDEVSFRQKNGRFKIFCEKIFWNSKIWF